MRMCAVLDLIDESLRERTLSGALMRAQIVLLRDRSVRLRLCETLRRTRRSFSVGG
jgi:hypothetical protein